MRFHLDENVNLAVARALELRGIDVTTSVEAALLGESDEQHIEFAGRESRVIFTQDADYLQWHRQGMPHAGIVYTPKGTKSIGDIVEFLCLLNDCVESHEMQNLVEYL
jgi:predicted nuclease of predicted toxin-antitoxin system